MTTTYEGPGYGECQWPVDPTCFGDRWDAMTPEQQEQGIALASSTLRRLTGYRVGGCPVTIRPCSAGSCAPYAASWVSSGMFRPGIDLNGLWVNNAGCGCYEACDHKACEIELPTPVGAVYEVKVDGLALDTDDYRVENGKYLVWQGTGDCPFPATQDVNLPDSAVGTFSVTFLNAYPVDRAGARAAAALAYEFGLACGTNTRDKCTLPTNVVSVVRQGVTYEITPGIFPDGYTGMDEVDVFIAAWNPAGLRQDSSVWSPGMESPRMITANGGGGGPFPPVDNVLDGGAP